MPTTEEQFTEALRDVDDTLEEVKVLLTQVRDVTSIEPIDAENVPNRVMVTDGSGNTVTSSITTTELNYLDNLTGNIQIQLDNKIPNKLALTNGVLITNNSGNIVTHSTVGVSELGMLDGVTSNVQTQLNTKQPKNMGSDNVNKMLFLDSLGNISPLDGVTAHEVKKLYGVTGNVQEQLDGKVNKNLGTASANKVLYTNASGIVTASAITSTELSMLKNVKSNIQTQIDDKQTQITSINNKVAANTLVGEVKWLAFSDSVSGWLLCDGRAVSRTAYAALFSTIGTTWGEGDGSTTFNLPDLIDKTVWGGSTAGGYKEAGLPDHDHSYSSYPRHGAEAHPDLTTARWCDGFEGTETAKVTGTSTKASVSNSIYGKSTTVQPPAAVLRPVIKY